MHVFVSHLEELIPIAGGIVGFSVILTSNHVRIFFSSGLDTSLDIHWDWNNLIDTYTIDDCSSNYFPVNYGKKSSFWVEQPQQQKLNECTIIAGSWSTAKQHREACVSQQVTLKQYYVLYIYIYIYIHTHIYIWTSERGFRSGGSIVTCLHPSLKPQDVDRHVLLTVRPWT